MRHTTVIGSLVLAGKFGNRGLLPAGAGLQPEDGGCNRLWTISQRLAIEALGDPTVGLDGAYVQFLAIMLPEGLGIDADDPGDVRLGHTIGRHGLDLTTAGEIGPVCAAAHQ